jgi:hypothetical protein
VTAYRIGRALQVIGMAFLPVALYVGLLEGEVRREVSLLFAGAVMFVVGWIFAQSRGSR